MNDNVNDPDTPLNAPITEEVQKTILAFLGTPLAESQATHLRKAWKLPKILDLPFSYERVVELAAQHLDASLVPPKLNEDEKLTWQDSKDLAAKHFNALLHAFQAADSIDHFTKETTIEELAYLHEVMQKAADLFRTQKGKKYELLSEALETMSKDYQAIADRLSVNIKEHDLLPQIPFWRDRIESRTSKVDKIQKFRLGYKERDIVYHIAITGKFIDAKDKTLAQEILAQLKKDIPPEKLKGQDTLNVDLARSQAGNLVLTYMLHDESLHSVPLVYNKVHIEPPSK